MIKFVVILIQVILINQLHMVAWANGADGVSHSLNNKEQFEYLFMKMMRKVQKSDEDRIKFPNDMPTVVGKLTAETMKKSVVLSSGGQHINTQVTTTITCPSGSQSYNGNCWCSPGYESSTGISPCDPCGDNSASSQLGASRCPCNIDYYSSTGYDDDPNGCQACSAGSITYSTQSTQCVCGNNNIQYTNTYGYQLWVTNDHILSISFFYFWRSVDIDATWSKYL